MIELLTVVAVIAVLASLLLPSLGLARSSAKSLKCASSQRQLVACEMAYAVDSNGFFTPVGWISGAVPGSNGWASLSSDPWYSTLICGGYLGPNVDARKWPNRAHVFCCPADLTPLPSAVPKRSFNIGKACVFSSGVYAPPRAESLLSPTKTVLFGERFINDNGNGNIVSAGPTIGYVTIDIDNFNINIWSLPGGVTGNGVTYVHAPLRANFSFADGHVQSANFQQAVKDGFKLLNSATQNY